MSSTYAHITSTYNTGPMLKCNGAWANDSGKDPITAPANLPDNSGEGNDGVITGTLTKIKFNRCTYGIVCDDLNFVRLVGTPSDELQGWFKASPTAPWVFFETAAEIPGIEKDGNDYLLKRGSYAMLMLSFEPVVLDDFNEGFGGGFS